MTTPSRAAHNPRLFDDSNFLKRGEPMPPPHIAGVLLDRLGLRRAAQQEQEAGIRKWLDGHDPSATLCRSLVRHGFGDLLDERP